MQEQWSLPPTSRYDFSSLNARPAGVFQNPTVQHRFYGTGELTTGPARFRFDPRKVRANAKAKKQLLAKYSRYRNRAVWAQALVLFDVVGIPLSHGVHLEYYFTTALPTNSLLALAVTPGLQILFILGMPLLVGWFYHWRGQRSGWQILFFAASVLAIAAALPLQWIQSYILIVLLHGLLLGVALGTLFTLSTLVLSSHFQFNLPLVSTQSGSMGFLGALVYTLIARYGQNDNGRFAPAITAAILASTLATATLLIRQVKADPAHPWTQTAPLNMEMTASFSNILKEKGTLSFVLGYVLVFFAVFALPLFIPILLNRAGPHTGLWTLITTLTTAAISACISAQPATRKRLGPVNTFIAACIFSGAVSILPIWMPFPWLAILSGGAYGIGLGGIMALHIRVSTVFHEERVVWHPDMPVRAAMVMALGGVSAFGGLLATALLLEQMESGDKLANGVAAGGLVIGGVLIAVGRWRRCGRFGVAI